MVCAAVCADDLCGAEGVTRADTGDGACRPADADCCRAVETALPETGRIACGDASRAGEMRALSIWLDAILPATAAAVTAAVLVTGTVSSLACDAPPAVMDGETGATRAVAVLPVALLPRWMHGFLPSSDSAASAAAEEA